MKFFYVFFSVLFITLSICGQTKIETVPVVFSNTVTFGDNTFISNGTFYGNGYGLTNVIATVTPESFNSATSFVKKTGDTASGQVKIYDVLRRPLIIGTNAANGAHSAVFDFSDIGANDLSLSIQRQGTWSVSSGMFKFYNAVQFLNNVDMNQNNITNANSIKITGDLVSGTHAPLTDETYDLGSLDKKWKDLYMSGSSIYLGTNKLSVTNGQLSIVNGDITNQPITSAGGNIYSPLSLGVPRTSLFQLYTFGTNNTGDPNVDIPQPNGIVIDGDTNVDKNLIFADNGTNRWAIQLYRGEGGKYLYVYNEAARINPLVISESGRVGINKTLDIVDYHADFVGTGLNDIYLSGKFKGTRPRIFHVYIDNTNNANPNSVKVLTSLDNITFTTYTNKLSISTNTVQIDDYGITIQFTAVTGHTSNDMWRFIGCSQLPEASLSVAPRPLSEVLIQTNGVWSDVTSKANVRELSYFSILNDTTNHLYIAARTKINSLYFNIATNAVGLNIKLQYWNGSIWRNIDTVTNWLSDETLNLTQSGGIYWNASTMSDATSTNLTIDDYVNEYYWIRMFSTNNPTVAPVLITISPHGSDRFSVYGANGDFKPVMHIDGKGDTYIKDYPLTESTLQSFYWKFLARPLPNTPTITTNDSVVITNRLGQSFPVNSTNKIIFAEEMSDSYNVYDATNSVWIPRSIEMHRLNVTVKITELDNASVIYLYLFENGQMFSPIDYYASAANNENPFRSCSYVFKPTHITNTYDVRLMHNNAGGTTWLTNVMREVRWFGEKIQ